MEIFEPREGKWADGPSMSTPRHNHGVAVFESNIYTSPVESSWERFNIRRNSWESIVNINEEEGPLDRLRCAHILGNPTFSPPFQFDANNNSVFYLSPMHKKRDWPGITMMDCLKIKHAD